MRVWLGHVHEKWSIRFIEDSDVPNINVGLEVNDYYPVRLDELLGIYHRAKNAREIKDVGTAKKGLE